MQEMAPTSQVGGCWIYSNLCIAQGPITSRQPPQPMVPAFLPREELRVSGSPVPAQTPHKSRRCFENASPTTTKAGQTQTTPPPEMSIQLILEPPQKILLLPFEAQRQGKLIAALVLRAASHHSPRCGSCAKTAPTLCVA